jgi:hypothetical protein
MMFYQANLVLTAKESPGERPAAYGTFDNADRVDMGGNGRHRFICPARLIMASVQRPEGPLFLPLQPAFQESKSLAQWGRRDVQLVVPRQQSSSGNLLYGDGV